MSKVIWILSIVIGVNLVVFLTLYFADKQKFFSWLFTFSNPVLHVIHFNDIYDVGKASPWVQKVLKYDTSNSLHIFSGDIISPSVVSNLMFGSQFIKLIEMIRFDYSVPGNHETDFQEERFMEFIKSESQNKWLLANLKHKDSFQTYGELDEYAIREISGLKFGLFGLVDQNWINSSKINKVEFVYEDFLLAARRITKILDEKGCKLIFAITHMSNQSDEMLLQDPENHIRMIFGGHDHIYYIRMENNRLLIKSGSDFDQFSSIRMQLSPEQLTNKTYTNQTSGNHEFYKYLYDDVTSSKEDNTWSFSLKSPNAEEYLNVNIEMVLIDHIKDDTNIEFDQYFESEILPLIADKMIVAMQLASDMDARESSVGGRETEVGDLISDLLRIDYGVDVSILNAGSITSQSYFPSGQTFYINNMIKMLMRPDPMQLVDMKGHDLVKLLENGLLYLPNSSSDFYVVSGVHMQVDPQKPAYSRIDISTLSIINRPINYEVIYSVAMGKFIKDAHFKKLNLTDHRNRNLPNSGSKPYYSLLNFYKLPQNPEYQKEFAIFKEFYPNVRLDELVDYEYKSTEKSLSKMDRDFFLKYPEKDSLAMVTRSLMKRLKFYSLAEAINYDTQVPIFVINPKMDGRIKIFQTKNEPNSIVV